MVEKCCTPEPQISYINIQNILFDTFFLNICFGNRVILTITENVNIYNKATSIKKHQVYCNLTTQDYLADFSVCIDQSATGAIIFDQSVREIAFFDVAQLVAIYTIHSSKSSAIQMAGR